MTEENDAPEAFAPPVETPPKRRFVDRLWGLRALIAVALASVIIGGLGGAAIARAGDHQDGNRLGPGRGGFQGGPGGPRGRRGFGGQGGFGSRNGQLNGQQNGQQQPPAAPSASPSAGQTS